MSYGNPPMCIKCSAYLQIYPSGQGWYCINGCEQRSLTGMQMPKDWLEILERLESIENKLEGIDERLDQGGF